MKIKLFFSAAIMAIAMTGCTSDEVVMTPETAEIPISFKAVTNNMTRAAASYDNQNPPKSISVWALMCSNPANPYASGETVKYYFDDSQPTFPAYNSESSVLVHYDGDLINIDGTTGNSNRVWPKYSPLHFFAFTSSTKIDQVLFGYRAADDFGIEFNYDISLSNVADHDDLLFALNNGTNHQGVKLSDTTNGSVSLEFKHLLSQICFEAENLDTSSEYEITDINLYYVKGKGKCVIKEILCSNGSVEWTDLSTPSSYCISDLTTIKLGKIHDGNTVTRINISNPKYNTSTTDHTYYDKENNEERDVYVGRAMNLIPQSLNKIDTYSPYIEVKFKVNGEAQTPKEIYLDQVTWEMGKRYTYKLIFSAGSKINYSVTVDDFTDYQKPTSGNVNTDYPDFEL